MVYSARFEEVTKGDTREEYPRHAEGYAFDLDTTESYTRGYHRRKDKNSVCYRGVRGVTTTHHDSLKPLKIHYIVIYGLVYSWHRLRGRR